MHILVIDGNHVEAEFRAKFGPGHEYSFFTSDNNGIKGWDKFANGTAEDASATKVAFCFSKLSHSPDTYNWLGSLECPVFFEVVWHSVMLSKFEYSDGEFKGSIFGFCGLPTLLNRSLLEVSLYHEADRAKLAETCAALGTDYRVVADRVGLVTPRVICQIINEACFTVQEGTATMQDVDLGMKLGTNYPHGPFAWANAIGVERVYAVLEAMWNDTHDERYKICPLLKRQALRGEPFLL